MFGLLMMVADQVMLDFGVSESFTRLLRLRVVFEVSSWIVISDTPETTGASLISVTFKVTLLDRLDRKLSVALKTM